MEKHGAVATNTLHTNVPAGLSLGISRQDLGPIWHTEPHPFKSEVLYGISHYISFHNTVQQKFSQFRTCLLLPNRAWESTEVHVQCQNCVIILCVKFVVVWWKCVSVDLFWLTCEKAQSYSLFCTTPHVNTEWDVTNMPWLLLGSILLLMTPTYLRHSWGSFKWEVLLPHPFEK